MFVVDTTGGQAIVSSSLYGSTSFICLEKPMDISVKDNIKAVQKQLNSIGKSKLFPKAANQAINKTATRGKTKLKRDLKEEMTTKNMKSINSRMKVWKSNPKTLYANIKIKDKFLNLINFKGAKQDKKPGGGVIATVGGVTRKFKGHFIANSRAGTRLAWHRMGKARKPIDTSVGMGISQAYAKVKPKLNKFIEKEFLVQMQRSVNYYLDKSWKK